MTERGIIELYGMKTGNCFRAVMALEEAGLAYRIRLYDPRTPGTAEETYLKLNATGKVPTLVDNTASGAPLVVTQSNAIMLYIAEKAPNRLIPLLGLAERTKIYERLFYFITDVIAPSHAGFFLKSKNEERAANLLSDRSLAAIEMAERFVTADPFIAGAKFSVADIAALTIVDAVRSDLAWKKLPALERWFEMVRQRPPIRRGAAAFDEPGEKSG